MQTGLQTPQQKVKKQLISQLEDHREQLQTAPFLLTNLTNQMILFSIMTRQHMQVNNKQKLEPFLQRRISQPEKKRKYGKLFVIAWVIMILGLVHVKAVRLLVTFNSILLHRVVNQVEKRQIVTTTSALDFTLSMCLSVTTDPVSSRF